MPLVSVVRPWTTSPPVTARPTIAPRLRGHLSFRCRTSATVICYLLSLIPDSEDCAKSEWRVDVEPGDRSPRRRRGPGRGGDERAPERPRRAAPHRGTPPDRRALALGAVGFPGRERARLARPLPRPRVRRPRPRWLRLQRAGRGLLRRLRGEDRGADPVRRRGDVRAEERRPAGLPGGDVGRTHRRALRRRRDRH